jgi:DNA invertase Pin-like site-specific DNA recombinase
LLDYCREGDVIVIVALDRLGRSLSHLVRTLDELRERGILVRSLREGIDTSTSSGRLVAGIFASLSEFERSLISERAAAARAAAIARGQRSARKPKLTAEQLAVAKAHAAERRNYPRAPRRVPSGQPRDVVETAS